jgi:hypothetical protein
MRSFEGFASNKIKRCYYIQERGDGLINAETRFENVILNGRFHGRTAISKSETENKN